MLSERLKKIASLVNKGAKVLDVGCDHGLLSVYLVEHEISSYVIASDVNDHALSNAVNIVKERGLENNIKTALAFGNNAIDDEIDTIVIAGMGYNTIINIMSLSPSLKNVKKIIIQTNNHPEEVRKFMVQKGYKIEKEIVVLEKEKYYEIISFIKGKKVYSKIAIQYGPCIIKNSDNKNYLKYQLAVLNKIYKNVENSRNIIRKVNIQNEIKKLTKIIEKLS